MYICNINLITMKNFLDIFTAGSSDDQNKHNDDGIMLCKTAVNSMRNRLESLEEERNDCQRQLKFLEDEILKITQEYNKLNSIANKIEDVLYNHEEQ